MSDLNARDLVIWWNCDMPNSMEKSAILMWMLNIAVDHNVVLCLIRRGIHPVRYGRGRSLEPSAWHSTVQCFDIILGQWYTVHVYMETERRQIDGKMRVVPTGRLSKPHSKDVQNGQPVPKNPEIFESTSQRKEAGIKLVCKDECYLIPITADFRELPAISKLASGRVCELLPRTVVGGKERKNASKEKQEEQQTSRQIMENVAQTPHNSRPANDHTQLAAEQLAPSRRHRTTGQHNTRVGQNRKRKQRHSDRSAVRGQVPAFRRNEAQEARERDRRATRTTEESRIHCAQRRGG